MSASDIASWAPAAAATAAVIVTAGIATSLFRRLFECSSSILHPVEYRAFTLIEKRAISHNTAAYRFALPSSASSLALPTGQHITVAVEIDGKLVSRSYTPTTGNGDLGHFELVVKSYPTGNVSRVMGELKVGDVIKVRGPKGAFVYRANMASHLTMIAGGTGLTPMLQIIRAVLANPVDATRISLVFANVNEEDILLRSTLDELAAQHADQFTVRYVLNNPPVEGWTGGVGFVSQDMIHQWCPAPADGVRVLICGPPPMVKAMAGHCEALGFDKARVVSKADDQVFKF